LTGKVSEPLVFGIIMYVLAGPYYPLGTIGTVPRAYDIFRAYDGMEWR
jgi:hypothetical protein